MTIAELNRRVNAVDVNKLADEALKENETEVLDANREQLQDGQRSDTTKITPRYKQMWYATRKNDMNPLAGIFTPDLKKTGDFYKGFFVKLLGGNKYTITSSDSKTQGLTDKYQPNIFGLNTRNTQDVGEQYVQPTFIKRLKNVLFK